MKKLHLVLILTPMMLSAGELPLLIAHRGASAEAPENTLAAFRMAWKEGADGIEGDFHLTADGQVVCIHDSSTKRTAGADLKVTESSLAQLKALDFGLSKRPNFKDEAIPTLSEVLDVLPAGKWFFLEIKDTARIVTPIAKILADKNADPEKVVLISFKKDVVQACREALPNYRTCWISELKDFEKPEKPEFYLQEINECGAQGLLFKEDAPVSPEWLKLARGNDRLLMAWTVDKKTVARRMMDFGIPFLATNRPGALRAELLED
jgi:glycerophosphoryl diester phosphodiesterase